MNAPRNDSLFAALRAAFPADLDATAIEQAMEALPGSELERARDIWRRKFGSVAGTPNERLKQMRFLASRGFSAGVVHQVVRGDEDL